MSLTEHPKPGKATGACDIPAAGYTSALERFLRNHVLANLVFGLVLVLGIVSYIIMPREQDPAINFNWIDITTVLPGATASDVEQRITDPLEEAVRKISDIKFVSSVSRAGVSSVLVRFRELDERQFEKRVTDLRREIRAKEAELPVEAQSPRIYEVTTANAFPSAIVVVTGPADDENLRRQAVIVRKGLERLEGVDAVLESALHEPELQVDFVPQRLERLGIGPVDLADTISAHFRDVSAGTARVGAQSWGVRMAGTDADPAYLAALPVLTAKGEVPLRALADVARGREKPRKLVRVNGRPGVLLSITKRGSANTLDLVERVKTYIAERNVVKNSTGVDVRLVDDQTQMTRDAIRVMQNNAAVGLTLVLVVTWMFLGGRIALLTCIGIPFTLAGTFWVLDSFGQTLNVSVLLGVVICLGMLVDDAVVVVEAIYFRLQRGVDTLRATTEALREVVAPVTTAVLTTMAAFLPLMLLPGILGQFMLIIPLVVTIALAISLVEAYWMLPAHIIAAEVAFARPSRIHEIRTRGIHRIRIAYTRLLVRVLRWPKLTFAVVLVLFIGAAGAVSLGKVKFDFFASDPIRLFYVNVEMPPGTPLEHTMTKTSAIANKVRGHVRDGEARSIVGYAGQMFTETAPFFGDQYGQIVVSLNAKRDGLREVDAMIAAMREDIVHTVGPARVWFLRIAGGPPTSKPISIKVRGSELTEIQAAADALKAIMARNPAIIDITDDAGPGSMELSLTVDHDAARRAGVNPLTIARSVRMVVDGEVVATMQDRGEELDVRVRAKRRALHNIDELLRLTLPASNGAQVPLSQLVTAKYGRGLSNVRHYNFRRSVTVEADIDKRAIDTVSANAFVAEGWEQLRAEHPSIELDYTGALDDIQESLDAIGVLFLLGVGLIYLILGTQFRSYFQPLMILMAVPLAFTGVVMGLLLTGNPLSLFTLYGVVALGGIAVNSAIVLISAANARLSAGMSVLHATIYAARRRVIPILITSLTTIAGLFSLATGLGGHSLLWGPVATVIVWGLTFSTCLTLLVVPLLYRMTMARSHLHRGLRPGAVQ